MTYYKKSRWIPFKIHHGAMPSLLLLLVYLYQVHLFFDPLPVLFVAPALPLRSSSESGERERDWPSSLTIRRRHRLTEHEDGDDDDDDDDDRRWLSPARLGLPFGDPAAAAATPSTPSSSSSSSSATAIQAPSWMSGAGDR
jgi:hypothetical protein